KGEAGFEKLVVIKRILPHLAEDPRFVSMFLTEARVTASLTHPNICQVFELGQIEGEYYLAMEYLEGVSLSRLIRQNAGRGLDLRIAAAIVSQSLEGLQFAHCFRQPGRGMVGIIHRDMSPSNVFVTSAGLVKVLDFGVAKVSHHSITTATGLKGKYPYMAPEQIRGVEVDGRADLFSVGVLLYEAVTGRSLFHRSSDFETLFAVVEGQRPRASESRHDVPLGLDEVIDRALSIAREERYASAREMSEALSRELAPIGGLATSRELAELVRRDCANDLEEERDRIHHATAYLKAMTDIGQEPPEFINRRPRAVVREAPPSAEPQASDASGGASGPGASSPVSGPGAATMLMPEAAGSIDLDVPASSRRNLVVVLVGAAALAGAAGWWLRGPTPAPDPAVATASDAPPAAATPLAPSGGPGEPAEPEPVEIVERSTATPSPRPPSSAPVPSAEPLPSTPDEARTGPADGDDPGDSDTARRRDTGRDAGKRHHGRRSAQRHADRTPVDRDTGFFSVDASPYATIYIDGDSIGITPLVRVALKPGKHAVRAVSETGVEDRFSITIRAGDTVTRRLNLELLKP
ncbi:MAG TPA: serine/threonine-protein kinase, partial [Kofleriaceae bacterium]|nr:serine/threonine-protein kinase [Kofleriaceae bacterium]